MSCVGLIRTEASSCPFLLLLSALVRVQMMSSWLVPHHQHMGLAALSCVPVQELLMGYSQFVFLLITEYFPSPFAPNLVPNTCSLCGHHQVLLRNISPGVWVRSVLWVGVLVLSARVWQVLPEGPL